MDTIGLIDVDTTSYPNLALMKLSAWHKKVGFRVVKGPVFDGLNYASKVFTFTDEPVDLPPNTVLGGTGWKKPTVAELPEEIEHTCPDYSLYGLDYSMGFTTRGCIRSGKWCFVPEKEGMLSPHAEVSEFLEHSEVVLLDNNILASLHGIKQIEYLVKHGVRVDFNQGLDARFMDAEVAKLLSKVKWRKNTTVRLACDSTAQIEQIDRAVELLRYHNVTPSRYFCYLLVRDIDDALERVKFLKKINVDPFAQPFIDRSGSLPSKIQRHFARWVNQKAEFKSQTWEEYRDRKLKQEDTTT